MDERPPRRRAVIIGSAHGIGAAGVAELAGQGWSLALLDHDPKGLASIAARIGCTVTEVADADDAAGLHAALTGAVDRLGGLDAIWSNAGLQVAGNIEAVSLEDLDASWAVNVRAHAIVAKVALPVLRQAGGGSILITASNSGLIAEADLAAYSVTKAAACALTRCLARDYARDQVRVNALCPGYVDTPFNTPIWSRVGGRQRFVDSIAHNIPLGRMATADEMGKIAAWLLSPQAAYITGQAIVADGGELVGAVG